MCTCVYVLFSCMSSQLVWLRRVCILACSIENLLYTFPDHVYVSVVDLAQTFATTSGDYNKNVSAGQKSSDGSLLFPRRSVIA